GPGTSDEGLARLPGGGRRLAAGSTARAPDPMRVSVSAMPNHGGVYGRGDEVVFATEDGRSTPECDQRLLDGVIFGKLGAEPEPIEFYRRLTESPEFRTPIAWGEVETAAFDGLILPGGHAPG